jgi:hypothetical protein
MNVQRKIFSPFFIGAFLYLILLSGILACRQEGSSHAARAAANEQVELPVWLQAIIKKEQELPVANPPARIFKYMYQGKSVFYLTSRCCDRPGQLFDEQGNLMCEPDGGITGQGDGRCSGFFIDKTDEIFIWEDKR